MIRRPSPSGAASSKNWRTSSGIAPGFWAVLDGQGAPHRARVVDEDVDLPIVVEHRADEARGGGRSPEVLRDGQDLDSRQRARQFLGVANPRSSQRLPRRSPMFSSNSPR